MKAHITVLALAAVIRASTVQAQAVDAVAHLRRGVELRRQGHDDEARAEFQLAYDATHMPVAAGQLGFAEQALGQWVAAEAHVREAIGAGDDDWVRRNRAALESAYTTIGLHVGHLEVRGEPAGAQVFVDGVRVGTLPMRETARVVAGTVDLEVRANGYETVARRVPIALGVLARERVTLPVVRRDSADLRMVRHDRDSTTRGAVREGVARDRAITSLVLGASLAGVGIAALSVGAVLFFGNYYEAYYSTCAPMGSCPPGTELDHAQTAFDVTTASYVVMGLGAAVAVGGVVWMVLTRPRPSGATALALTPSGITLSGRSE